MTQITVYSPLGINMVESRAAAPRIPKLEGARIGLLNNSKTNSLLLQEEIVKLLEERYGLTGVAKNIKPNAALRAEGLEDFSKEVDAVIAALGD
jgi:hypothetical protein